MKNQLIQSLQLLTLTEKLKCELRHSWLSTGRQESVAEHSWRLSLMVCLFAPYLEKSINLEKAIKMAIIHDLAEAETGDIPIFASQNSVSKQQKIANEQIAMQKIKDLLNNEIGNEIYDLWSEYENKQTYEAKFVNALDKIEAHIQHGEAGLPTWEHREKLMVFQPQWLDQHCEFDTSIALLRDLVKETLYDKLIAHGENLDQLRKEAALSTSLQNNTVVNN